MRYLLLICGDGAAYEAMSADPEFLPNCESWSEARGGRLVITGGL